MNKESEVSLSFNKGYPIARIEGGIHNGKIIYVYDPESCRVCCKKCSSKCETKKNKCCKKCKVVTGGCCLNLHNDDEELDNYDPYDYVDENYLRAQKNRLSVMELSKLKRALLLKNSLNLEGGLLNVYNDAKKRLDDNLKKELVIHDGKVVPLPNINSEKGTRIYIAGPTGSGKSTFASMIMREYKKMYPGNDIMLFSNEMKDPVIDEHKPVRILLDDSLIDNPIQKEELENSLCVFDDIDAMTDKDIELAVEILRDNLLKEGRKHNIFVICTAHQLTNYRKTRNILNDCDSIVFFPKSNVSGIKHYLKTYGGLSKRQIEEILALPSRWVCYNKNYPGIILYSSGVYLLSKK